MELLSHLSRQVNFSSVWLCSQNPAKNQTWNRQSLEGWSPFDNMACLTAVEELLIMLTSAENHHTVTAFFEGVMSPYLLNL